MPNSTQEMGTMDTKQSSAERLLRTRLLKKLNPENFRQVTGTMAAVLGFLLDTAFLRPSITAITVTSDGYLLADTDEPRFGCFLGDYKDLIRSWRSLLRVANLRIDERMLAECLFAAKIGHFDRTVA
jgi:hypothetical protein